MMKKLLLVLSLFFSASIYAQLSVPTDSVYALFDTNEEDLAVHNFHLTTTPTDTIKWSILSIDVSTGWLNDIFICDATQCYDSTVNSNEYPLDDNTKRPLDVHFLNNQLVGDGIAKLLVWDVNDSINTLDTVTYVVKVEAPSAIQNIKEIEVSVFPNPVSKFVNINNLDISTLNKIEIYNVIGKKVFQKQILSSNNKIDFNDFDKGVYIVKLLGSDNKNYYTKNIIKK